MIDATKLTEKLMEKYKKHYSLGVSEHQMREIAEFAEDHFSKIDISEPVIFHTKWCVWCWPKKVHASVTFKGDSLCEKCFNGTELRSLK